jgi:hypothetical protein
MKKQTFTVTLLAALLASALAATLLANSAKANFTPPNVSLNVNIESPQNNRTYTRTVQVAFTYTSLTGSPVELQSPEYMYILDGEKWEVGGQKWGVFSPEFNGSVYSTTLSRLSNGVHTLRIRVTGSWQELGDWKWPFYQGYSFPVAFIIDAFSPRIHILSPEPSVYNVSEVPLTFTLNEPASQRVYCVDGLANVTVSGNTTLTGLSGGEHTVMLYAWDAAGNVGTSETVTFTVAAPPTSLLINAAVIASAATVSFGLVAYFLRRNRRRIEA